MLGHDRSYVSREILGPCTIAVVELRALVVELTGLRKLLISEEGVEGVAVPEISSLWGMLMKHAKEMGIWSVTCESGIVGGKKNALNGIESLKFAKIREAKRNLCSVYAWKWICWGKWPIYRRMSYAR